MKLLWFHQNLIYFFTCLGHVSNFMILNLTKPFDISAIFFSISRDILMSISSIQEMSLSNRVACEHAIKLIFVDSAGCDLLLVLVVCCDNVLHCLIASCAKKWIVLENQGGNSNYAFYRF